MRKASINATAQLPDLIPLPPSDLRMETIQEGDKTRYRLRFSQAIGNIGKGPLQVSRVNSSKACPGRHKAAGYQTIFFSDGSKKSIRMKYCMVYHPVHKHWHIANMARYELCRVNPYTGGIGDTVAKTDKVSFCVTDEFALEPTYYQGTAYEKRYRSCKSKTFGLTPGWAEDYDYSVYGQWIDVTELPDGMYYLRITVDPDEIFQEETRSNNVVWRRIRIFNNRQNVI